MGLRGFLEEMERKAEVVHVKERVSPCFEASSIMKVFDSDPILHFDKVKGHETKIVANVCGIRQRIGYALKTNVENLYRKLTSAWCSPVRPKVVKDSPVKEVVEKANLSELPVLNSLRKGCWVIHNFGNCFGM